MQCAATSDESEKRSVMMQKHSRLLMAAVLPTLFRMKRGLYERKRNDQENLLIKVASRAIDIF